MCRVLRHRRALSSRLSSPCILHCVLCELFSPCQSLMSHFTAVIASFCRPSVMCRVGVLLLLVVCCSCCVAAAAAGRVKSAAQQTTTTTHRQFNTFAADPAVSTMESGTRQVIGSFMGGGGDTMIKPLPSGSTLMLTQEFPTPSISFYDLNTNTYSTPVAVSSKPRAVAFSPDESTAVVGTDLGETYSINIQSNSIITSSTVKAQSVVWGTNDKLYSSHRSTGIVSVWNSNTLSVVAEWDASASSCQDLSLSSDGSTLYYVGYSASGGVAVMFNTGTSASVGRVSLPATAFGVQVTQAGTAFVVTNSGATSYLCKIDGQTFTLVLTKQLTSKSQSILLSKDETKLLWEMKRVDSFWYSARWTSPFSIELTPLLSLLVYRQCSIQLCRQTDSPCFSTSDISLPMRSRTISSLHWTTRRFARRRLIRPVSETIHLAPILAPVCLSLA